MGLNELNRKLVKKGGPGSRARTHEIVPLKLEKPEKAEKVLRSLLSAITEDDVEQVVQVWREAMSAVSKRWIDQGKDAETGRAKGFWEELPDHRTRIEAAKMVAAYKEGLPVARQVTLGGTFEELRDVLNAAKTSPAAQEALRMLGGLDFGIQKTGGEKVVEVPSEEPA